ncbi:MAG: cytochrome c3 family protein [Gammaproteobacteria bacterium]|nr:cytochrome c3 family protein [Gammaproteobacteria bacterium]
MQNTAIRRVARCLLLLALLGATQVDAQQTSGKALPAVSDNVGPHPAPVQPLPFSHKTHLAAGLPCQNCHMNAGTGEQMGFPATDTCMMCHRAIATDKPAIKKLSEYAASGEPIPWVRVYAIAPGITWSHRVHVDAGMQCDTCHGDIHEADVVAETKSTRAMATCISCHEVHGAAAECVTCHAWPTDRLLGIEAASPGAKP